MQPVKIMTSITNNLKNCGETLTEGPRSHAISYFINKHAAGMHIKDVLIRSKKISIDPCQLIGEKIERSESFGKNIVIFISNGYAIRVHTLIYGIVKIYRVGESIEKPEKQIRLRIATDDYWIIGFNTPIIEVDRAENILSYLESNLGPDPLKSNWCREVVFEKLRNMSGVKIGVALLDQRLISGIGNIMRNEILFRAGVNPERNIEELSIVELNRILDEVEKVSKEFYLKLINGENLKSLYQVYNKYRGKCPKCGSSIKFYRQLPINRKTFICPNCQK